MENPCVTGRPSQSRADELEERLINFAVRIIKLVTSSWLRIIERSKILPGELLRDIIDENTELCKILVSSPRTAEPPKMENGKW